MTLGMLIGHGVEVKLDKFFVRVDCKLVNTHLVSLGCIRVMSLDLEDVFLKDESSVGFLLRSPAGTILVLPVSKYISFLFLPFIEQQEGNGQSDNNELFSHGKST